MICQNVCSRDYSDGESSRFLGGAIRSYQKSKTGSSVGASRQQVLLGRDLRGDQVPKYTRLDIESVYSRS